MSHSDKQFITRKVRLLCQKFSHTLKVNNLMGFSVFNKKIRVLFSLKDPFYPCFIVPNGDYIVVDSPGTLEFFLFTNYDEHILRIFSDEDFNVEGSRIKFQGSMSTSARLAHYKSSLENGVITVNSDIFSEAHIRPTLAHPLSLSAKAALETDSDSSVDKFSNSKNTGKLPLVSYDDLDSNDDSDSASRGLYSGDGTQPINGSSNGSVQEGGERLNHNNDDYHIKHGTDYFSRSPVPPTPSSAGFRVDTSRMIEGKKIDHYVDNNSKFTESSISQEGNTSLESSQASINKSDEIKKLCQEYDAILNISSASSVLEILVDQQLNGVDINLEVLRRGLQRRLFCLPAVSSCSDSTQESAHLGSEDVPSSFYKESDRPNTLIHSSLINANSSSQELVPFNESDPWEVLPSAFQSFSVDTSAGFSNAGFSKMSR
ncbi:hypothetical protein DSO57_1038188 [Entomophthora muscae]|uniref:Uncharacterized protein n=1 Tax=Entomophthora muscae TaxID=34485 RepID=A0ACC2U861_9FUNG|nr:hypothetical protein DSO57_1038188 [Entomophthora muscae]